jgi:hypothetical protein
MTEPTGFAEPTEERIKLSVPATVTPTGDFEILPITAGEGNGWNFSADTLKASVPLWDKVTSLIDHAGWFDMPSIQKLCGVLHSPEWFEEKQAIKVHFTPFGPQAQLARQLGQDYLESKKNGRPVPNIGFSADISFTANKHDVIAITRVRTGDLVVDPARGGEFLRVLNQAQGNVPSTPKGGTMTEPTNSQPAASVPDQSQPVTPWHSSELEAARNILGSRQAEEERAAQELKTQ